MRADAQNAAVAEFADYDGGCVDHGALLWLVFGHLASEMRQGTKVDKPLSAHRRHDGSILVANFKNAVEIAEDGSALIG